MYISDMDILSIIGRLQEKRRSEKITPDHVPEVDLMNEIHREAKEEINSLCSAGNIGFVKLVNNNAFFIKEK